MRLFMRLEDEKNPAYCSQINYAWILIVTLLKDWVKSCGGKRYAIPPYGLEWHIIIAIISWVALLSWSRSRSLRSLITLLWLGNAALLITFT